jgi:hypothetical protein
MRGIVVPEFRPGRCVGLFASVHTARRENDKKRYISSEHVSNKRQSLNPFRVVPPTVPYEANSNNISQKWKKLYREE